MSESAVIRFAAVRGHERICHDLRTAATQGRLAHALLFAGPDGIGKRSVALALAAWQQCETGADDACGECGACRQVAAGSHPDVHVLSVASGKKEIGVERVRALKRFTQLRPSRGKGKLAIIDDAHMLTVAAQNALLKTLEEPPEHSLLILVVNNADALLPTVRSRCQRVRFAPLTTEAVVDILTRHGLDAATADAMAALAEGSPGRALALSAGLAGRAAVDQQLATLSTARYVDLMHLAEALRQPETLTGMKLEALLAAYRDAAVRAVGAGHLVQPGGSHADQPSLSVRAALRRADAVQAAWTALRRGNPNRQLLLEALLLDLARS